MKKILSVFVLLVGVALLSNSAANSTPISNEAQETSISVMGDTLYGVYDMYAYPENSNHCLKGVKVYEERNACGSYYALIDGDHYRVKEGRGGTGNRYTHYINYNGDAYRFCL